MANRKTTRRERREKQERKTRTIPGASASDTSKRNLLAFLAAASSKGAQIFPDADDEDDLDDDDVDDDVDVDAEDKVIDDEKEMDEEEDKEVGDEDEDEKDYDPAEINAIVDAVLALADGGDADEDVEDETMSHKARKLAIKKKNAAKNVLASIESELDSVKLPAGVKKLLVQIATRQKEEEATKTAERKTALILRQRKQERLIEKKRVDADQAYVDALIEEKLMSTRQGRQFGFGNYSTERGAKSFDRTRAGSVNQLSGQYRRGNPEFKLLDVYRALTNPAFATNYIKEFKALGGSTGSAGGYTVPEEWAKDFIQLLRTKATVRKFARVYPMATDTLHLPSQDGATNAQWVGENNDISSGATDQTFNEIVFTAKNLVAFSKTSNQLLADSSYDAEQIVREDIRKVVALKEDTTFLTGTSSSTVPTSIYEAMSSGNKLVGSGTSGELKAEDIYTLMNAVEENSGQVDVFVTSPTGLMKIRKLQDTTGNFIFSSAAGVNAPTSVVETPYGSDPVNYGPVGTLFERPLYLTTQVPKVVAFSGSTISALTGGSGTLLFAGESQYAAIGQRAQIEIAASNVAGNAFAYNQTWFRAIMREDFKLTQAGAWAVLGFV